MSLPPVTIFGRDRTKLRIYKISMTFRGKKIISDFEKISQMAEKLTLETGTQNTETQQHK